MTYPGQHRLADNASDDFRQGMAYAMHLLRHVAGGVHGVPISDALVQSEPRRCCRRAILAFVEGTVIGVEEAAGVMVGLHDHDGQSGAVVAS